MTLSDYLALIDGQRQEGDALAFETAPWWLLSDVDRAAVIERLATYARAGDDVAVTTLGLLGDVRAMPTLEQWPLPTSGASAEHTLAVGAA